MLETHVTVGPYHCYRYILSKVNERLAHRQFVTFLDNDNKLSQFQSGKRKNHSTETVLLSVTDDLLKAMDEKKISILVMMDMSKAFDSINHDMLLFKLRSLCVSPSALEWFKSSLKGRFCLLSQLIMEFHRGPFLALFCLRFISMIS